uniref:Transporter n=1 Tax=Parascaris univalens TaxID=6257 RepID=A0A915BNF2_PARUN
KSMHRCRIELRLRELVNTSPEEAARLHVQAISILDETDRLIAAKLPNASSLQQFTPYVMQTSILRQTHCNKVAPQTTTTTMRFTTFADLEETDPESVKASSVGNENPTGGGWALFRRKFSTSGSNNDSDGVYEARKAGKACNFCMDSGKEAQNKGDDDVRDLWKTQFEFFLSVVGFMVGVGNTLKFPSLAYQHGGGVFLIPYFVCLALFGLPIVFMHLSIGQYSGLSASGAFYKMMPVASGIGWTLVLLALPVSIYYNIIVAWSIYYFWFALKGFFTGGLPWDHCNPNWPNNIPCCLLGESPECFLQPHAISSPEAYFHYEVLNRTAKIYPEDETMPYINLTATRTLLAALNITLPHSNSYDITGVLNPELGPVQSHLALALAIAWILVFFGVFKGIGSIGWAVTITATLPYLLLGILLLRGVSLAGANEGLAFLFKPKMEELWSIPMWKAAAEQVFYSLGIDAGPLISMASFSRYRNNIYRDAVAVVVINTFTSVLAGMVIFSFVGFLAQSQNQPINAILQHDSLYIAFTVYPGVTSFMDMMGPMWAALFFAMLTISALDAEFAWLEMIISSVMKQFGQANRRVEIRLVVGLCLFCFVCGLPLTTRGGIFIFHSIENLNANWNSFSLSLIQIVVVCYIYGVDNFIKDVGEMLRVPTNLIEELRSHDLNVVQVGFWKKAKFFFGPTGTYIRWSWCLFSPCILGFLLFASIFSYQRVTFEDYPLPVYYELVAWIAMIGPLFVIPLTAMHTIYEAYKNGKPLSSVFDSSQWRHKKDGEDSSEPKHIEKEEQDYWSIADPVSRVASARRPNATMVDDVGYNAMVEMINEWAKKNAATLGERYEPSSAEPQQSQPIPPKQLNTTSSSSATSRSASCHELTLFGAPPSDGVVQKTDTVIQKIPKGNAPRRNRMIEVETPFSVAKFNLTYETKVRLEGNKSCDADSSLAGARSTSANELPLVKRLNDEVEVPNTSGSHSRDASPGPFSTHPLQKERRISGECQSIGSISITPIDSSRNRSSSSASNPDISTLNRRRLLSIKRPKPIDAPPPFTQL